MSSLRYGPEDNDPGTVVITCNVDETVTIKVRSPGDRSFSEVEMPMEAWLKLRSVEAASPARQAYGTYHERRR